MIEKIKKSQWKRFQEEDIYLKELAIKAGLQNDYKRVNFLIETMTDTGGEGIKNEAEEDLAIYLVSYTPWKKQ